MEEIGDIIAFCLLTFCGLFVFMAGFGIFEWIASIIWRKEYAALKAHLDSGKNRWRLKITKNTYADGSIQYKGYIEKLSAELHLTSAPNESAFHYDYICIRPDRSTRSVIYSFGTYDDCYKCGMDMIDKIYSDQIKNKVIESVTITTP